VNFNNPIELNRYGYTASNPINYNDPTGLTLAEQIQLLFKVIKNNIKAIASEVAREVAMQALSELISAFLISEARHVKDHAVRNLEFTGDVHIKLLLLV
jgi:hypothetical protein